MDARTELVNLRAILSQAWRADKSVFLLMCLVSPVAILVVGIGELLILISRLPFWGCK